MRLHLRLLWAARPWHDSALHQLRHPSHQVKTVRRPDALVAFAPIRLRVCSCGREWVA